MLVRVRVCWSRICPGVPDQRAGQVRRLGHERSRLRRRRRCRPGQRHPLTVRETAVPELLDTPGFSTPFSDSRGPPEIGIGAGPGGCLGIVRFSTSTAQVSPTAAPSCRAPLAVASSRPSGLNATARIESVWPVRMRRQLAGGQVPQPRCLVDAGGGEQGPVRAERHPHDPAGVAGEGAQVLAGGRVPQPRRLVGAPAVASRVPSGLNATLMTPPWPARVRRCWPVQGAQPRRPGGRVPQPRRLAVGGGEQVPSGLNATPTTPRTPPVWSARVRRCSPVAGSHSRAVLSQRCAVASRVPSGLNATPMTPPVWPARVRRCSPVAGSHSRAVLSERRRRWRAGSRPG